MALLSPIDERDYLFKNIFNIRPLELGTYHSLRDKMMPVRNQETTSMCTAFSICAIKEYQEQLNDYFSPEYIYSKRATPVGMYIRDALDILIKQGICREYYHPFKKAKKAEADLDAPKFKIDKYCKIETIEEAKQALLNNYPIIAVLPFYSKKVNFWVKSSDKQEYHCVVITGFYDNMLEVRNSWGSNWNGDGYTFLPFSDWNLVSEAYIAYDSDSPDVKPLKKEHPCNSCCIF